MNISQLRNLIALLPGDAEVRIGDQIEAGPYLHQEVGGVWRSLDNGGGHRAVILCAGDSDLWKSEELQPPDVLPLLWKPPPPSSG